jgi:hypothetical protein
MAKVSKGWSRFENGADVAEIAYEGYKAQNEVDKAVKDVKPGGGGGGGAGGGGGDGKSGTKTLADTRVGTVQASHVDGFQAATARTQVDAFQTATEPMHAVKRLAEPLEPMQPMHALSPMQQAEPMRAAHLTMPDRVEPLQAAHRAEPMQMAHLTMPDRVEPMQPLHALSPMQQAEPMQAAHLTDRVEPLQAAHRAEPMQMAHLTMPDRVEPLQPFQRAEAVEQLQPMYRSEAPQAMHRVDAMPAQDSTMTSGVSMTAGTPAHHAAQPMQMHEAYSSSVDETPAEPMQRTQASHVFQTLEPTQSQVAYSAPAAYSGFEAPAEGGYNPLMAQEQFSPATAYEADAQAGGAPVQPLRPTVAHERPTRPSAQ